MSTLRPIPYAVLAAGLLVAGGASAQSLSTIDAREAYQQDRIQDGRRDGALTRGETARLEQGEARIDRYQSRAESNGYVSPGERQHLDNMINHENREIYHDAHNNQHAWGGRDGWDHREGINRGNDGNHNGWDQAREGQDHREGWNHGPDGGHNGWNPGGANGQPHQPGMPGGMQNAGGHQYGDGHSGWNGGGMQPGAPNGGGQYGRPAIGGFGQSGMQNVSGQAGRPNYGGFQQGAMQNAGGQPGRPATGGSIARPVMAAAPAAAPRAAMPVRTASAGGRSIGGGGHR